MKTTLAFAVGSLTIAIGAYSYISSSRNDKNKPLWLIIGSLMLIGATLRFWSLGSLSFWVDEAISTLAAAGIVNTGHPFLPSGWEYTRSLPHLVVMARFIEWFGLNEEAARLPSVIFGALTTVLLYLLGFSMKRRIEGLIAAGALALTPWFIWFGREARMYAMFQFMLLLALFCFYLFFRTQSAPRGSCLKDDRGKVDWRYVIRSAALAISVVAFIISFQIHVLTFIVIPGLLIFFIAMLAIEVFIEHRSLASSKNMFALVICAGGFILAVILLGVDGVARLVPKAPPHLQSFDVFFYFRFLALEFPVFSVLALIGVFSAIKKHDEASVFVLSLFVVPLIGMSFVPEKLPRYIFNIMPFYLLLAGFGATYIWGSVAARCNVNSYAADRQTRRYMASGIAVIVFVFILFYSFAARSEIATVVLAHGSTDNAAHSNWKKVASALSGRDKDAVIIPTDPVTAAYYLGTPKYFLFEHMPAGQIKDRYTNARVIPGTRELDVLISKSENGYVIIDTSHWNVYLSDGLKQHIIANLQYEPQASDNTIWVFSWPK